MRLKNIYIGSHSMKKILLGSVFMHLVTESPIHLLRQLQNWLSLWWTLGARNFLETEFIFQRLKICLLIPLGALISERANAELFRPIYFITAELLKQWRDIVRIPSKIRFLYLVPESASDGSIHDSMKHIKIIYNFFLVAILQECCAVTSIERR